MKGEFRELPKESREGDKHTADYTDEEGNYYNLDVYKVIKASDGLTVESVGINSLENFTDDNCWYDENGQWLNPRQIVEAYKSTPDLNEIIKIHPEWREHIEKIENSDYQNHPLIFIEDKFIDGMHKLVKALIHGSSEVKVKRFIRLPQETLRLLEYREETPR